MANDTQRPLERAERLAALQASRERRSAAQAEEPGKGTTSEAVGQAEDVPTKIAGAELSLPTVVDEPPEEAEARAAFWKEFAEAQQDELMESEEEELAETGRDGRQPKPDVHVQADQLVMREEHPVAELARQREAAAVAVQAAVRTRMAEEAAEVERELAVQKRADAALAVQAAVRAKMAEEAAQEASLNEVMVKGAAAQTPAITGASASEEAAVADAAAEEVAAGADAAAEELARLAAMTSEISELKISELEISELEATAPRWHVAVESERATGGERRIEEAVVAARTRGEALPLPHGPA